jgi:hypothetical protein
MAKVIPMSAEASYRKALEKVAEDYKFNEYPEDIQFMLRKMFREGWIASKYNTFEILETLSTEANDGTKQ